MYTNNNIPQKSYYKPTNSYNYQATTYPVTYNSGDRFIGGGFLGPFILGGIGGYLVGRPNNYNQGPIPVYFPQGGPYPYPPYSNTNIYY